MSSVPKTKLTPEEYLSIERRAEYKSDFFKGEMFAMVGASRRHNLITLNTGGELREQLKGRSCETYASDIRVKVDATGLYTYPDVVVVCEEPQFEDNELDTLLNPTVLIEVLSQSTEAYDRGRKFAHYRNLDSLSDYLLIAQDKPHIEHYTRQPDNQWLLSETTDADGVIPIASIDC
jgi:Uma2 family endonuclease